MLGHGAQLHAEHQHVASRRLGERDGDEVPVRHGEQRLLARRLTPVGRVGDHRLGLRADGRPPYPAQQPEAVAAHALDARLMVVGRAEPGPRLGDNRCAPRPIVN